MILLLDIGNTRLKWALAGPRGWTAQGVLSNQEIGTLALSQWQNLPRPMRVVGVNVAGEAVRVRVEGQLARWRLWPQWLKPKIEACGVRSGYQEPSQLGPDRWTALVAARKIVSGNCVVANAGTALTIDVLDAQGLFRGGVILPGLAMMRQALAANTARLQVCGGMYHDFPGNTADAIFSGSIHAACGAIDRLRSLLDADAAAPATVILSGGTAPDILPRLAAPVIHRENLVLEGVEILAEESNS